MSRHFVWTAVVLLVAAAPVAAQRTPDGTRLARAVQPQVIRAHLEFLADDALEGRGPGTRGGELAAKYIAAQYERLGLEPAGDSGTYFHRIPVITLTPSPTLAVAGNPLRYRSDYVLWSMRDDSLVTTTGEMVFVGYGIVAPEYDWNDYDGVDVRGKIVVALVNDPGLRDSTLFRGPILTYYGRWTYKIEEAERQGAAGILLVHTTESATYPWTTVASSWTGPQVRIERAPTSLMVAGWLTDTAAADLFRRAGLDLTALSREAATRAFQARPLGTSVEATVRSDIRRSTTHNVVGRLPSRGPNAAQAVVLGAHYDHLGIGTPVDGDSIYNGAMDNASGTAALLAAAEAFGLTGVRPARSLLFIAFGAEESGLLGSEAFVQRPTIPRKSIVAVLNMDVMNLSGKTEDISALGLDRSSLGEVFERAAKAEQLRVTTNYDALLKGSFFRSDHFPFARAGVPALSLESGTTFVNRPADWGAEQQADYTAHRYHQPSDEVLPSFDYEGAVQELRVILRTALAVADAARPPAHFPP